MTLIVWLPSILTLLALTYGYIHLGRFLYMLLTKHVNKLIKFLFISAYILPGLIMFLSILALSIDEFMGYGNGRGGLIGLSAFFWISIIVSIVLMVFGGCAFLFTFVFKQINKNKTVV